MTELLQYVITGVTVGSIYGLIALGFVLVYNSSHVINFAQGDLQMIGGMMAVAVLTAGLPLPIAVVLGTLGGAGVGFLLYKAAIQPAGNAGPLPLVVITLGAALVIRGAAESVWGRGYYSLPAFSGDEAIHVMGVTVMPQSLWVLGLTAAVVIVLTRFFDATKTGKAILATSIDPDAATLMGIDTRRMKLLCFGLGGFLASVAGVAIAPIAFTYSTVGLMLGLKGFVAAVLGGLGNFKGAVLGGLILGITETMMSGYGASDYKDAVAFLLILVILVFMPRGLFGASGAERV
ncbi:branched-chain amino acid ABC transporter permease [Thauera sinica]|nr:branched-chain amino acid ABC transporter permease [Thauera sp. K11]